MYYALQASSVSADLNADAYAWDIRTGLENMPNIGTVDVAEMSNSSSGGDGFNSSVWKITFTSEVGAFPSLEVRFMGEPLNRRKNTITAEHC